MHLVVDRFVSDDDSTLSHVELDGAFVAFGLEDEYRGWKLPGETRIPAGSYRVGVRHEGGFHGRYSRRFPHIHRGMLHILDVPRFTWILLHCGNTDEDTAGCLLLGAGASAEPGDMRLFSSVRAYLRVYALTIDAALARDLTIEIQDNDGAPAPVLV